MLYMECSNPENLVGIGRPLCKRKKSAFQFHVMTPLHLMTKLVTVDSGRHLPFIAMVALKVQNRLFYGITQSFHFSGCLLLGNNMT
jgi:hypothetical protein